MSEMNSMTGGTTPLLTWNQSILICGVGGQGTVLASKLIASAAMECGAVVHSAETIGMAQRGGSVTSHVRIGEAYSPLIPLGGADILLAFEPAEAVRNLEYLKEDGLVIVNSVPVKPTTETLYDTGYDGTKMIEYLKAMKGDRCIVVDAEELCAPFGSSKFFNIAVLGVLVGTGVSGIPAKTVIHEIETRVNPRFVEINKKAFEAGMQIGEKHAFN